MNRVRFTSDPAQRRSVLSGGRRHTFTFRTIGDSLHVDVARDDATLAAGLRVVGGVDILGASDFGVGALIAERVTGEGPVTAQDVFTGRVRVLHVPADTVARAEAGEFAPAGDA